MTRSAHSMVLACWNQGWWRHLRSTARLLLVGVFAIVGLYAPFDVVAQESTAWNRQRIDAEGQGEVAIGDIDGDGDLDVIASTIDNTVTWWENAIEEGTVWVEHEIGDLGTQEVTAADIDGDGDLDVVAVAQFDGTIRWWENRTGIGAPWTRRTIESGLSFALDSVDAADLDGDGDFDVLIAGVDVDTVAWWENVDGDGRTWLGHVIDAGFDSARSARAADMDGDGTLDVLAGANKGDEIAWWSNVDGSGEIWAKRTVASAFLGVTEVVPIDLDGDGDHDVLAAAEFENTISWWENLDGNGLTWEERVVTVEISRVPSIGAADMDGDGDSDLFSMAWDTNEVTWWENDQGDGESWIPRLVDEAFDSPARAVAADLNADGAVDLIAAGTGKNLTWWKNTRCFALTRAHSGSGADPVATPIADGRFEEGLIVDLALSGATDPRAADIDGDGDTDIVVAAETGDAVYWAENLDGLGTGWQRRNLSTMVTRPGSLWVDDMDGDGDIDVLSASDVQATVRLWENVAGDGSVWLEETVSTDVPGTASIAAADVDGDGDLDVLAAAGNSGQISWWESTQAGWIGHPVDNDFDDPLSVLPADLDGDDDIDLLTTSFRGGVVAWHENVSGDGSVWNRWAIDSFSDGDTRAVAADLDGDGDLDVAVITRTEGLFAWYENSDGAGKAWTQHLITLGDSTRAVAARDLDRDGDIDLILAATSPRRLTWWENVGGTAEFWIEHEVEGASFTSDSIEVADIDGDDDLDIVVTACCVSQLEWSAQTYDAVCPADSHAEGDEIALTAEPDPGWTVNGWFGTDDDTSVALENLVTIPDAPRTVSVDYRLAGGQLAVVGSCPGDVEISVSGTSESATIALLGSAELGTSSVPAGRPCEGLPLAIESPQLLTTFLTGPLGNHTIERTLSAASCGSQLQAVDLTVCAATPTAKVPAN